MRKYQLNENYFESIDSEEKAYWLGFIAADGCVICKRNRYFLQLILSEKDKDSLELFKKHIDSQHPIRYFKKLNRLDLGSKKIVQDLIKLGITPKKTFTLKFPNIDKKYYRDYIRGYFDGDGCISCCEFSIACASIDHIKFIQNILTENLQLNKTKIYTHKSGCFYLRYSGKYNLEKIYKFLYNDSLCFMNRKKEKFISEINSLPGNFSRKVNQIDLSGNVINNYDSIFQASVENNIDNSSISKCCRKKVKSAGNYIWSYND